MGQNPSPGSLIFFAGEQAISRVISFGTCSWSQLWRGEWFSHVGLAYRANAHSPEPSLCESTSLGTTGISGVQTRLLADAVAAYPGKVWGCDLNRYNALDTHLSNKLRSCIMSKVGLGYDALGAAVCGTTRILRRSWRRKQFMFCSELAVWCLRQVDVAITNPEYSPGNYSPAALARDSERCSLYDPIYRMK